MTFSKRIARYIHRYLGITTGFIVFIVCITGCILLVRPEVEHICEPAKYYTGKTESSTRKTIDELVAIIEKEESQANTNTSVVVKQIHLPANTAMNYRALLSFDDGTDHWNAFLYINPFSGKICGYNASRVAPFFREVKRIHRFLGLPVKIGRPIVGTSTLIFVLIMITGLIRWFPIRWCSWKNWKNSLTLTLNKGKKRVLYDLHNTLGFYVAIPLLLLALTGLWLSFGWFRDMGNFLLGKTVPLESPTYLCQTTNDSERLSLQSILDKQRELTPQKRDMVFRIPTSRKNEPVCIQYGGGNSCYFFKDSYYWDIYQGKLLGCVLQSNVDWRDQVREAIIPLHTGILFGNLTRYLFFAVCFIASLLVITGYWLTFERRSRKNQTITKNEASSNN